jgi:DNA-binding NtrC family response regulator
MDQETTTLQLPSPPRRWRLRFLTANRERLRLLSLGESLVVGSGADADLTLVDPTVSACHCRIDVTKEGLLVIDQSSKNGLFVGGSRVERVLLSQAGAAFSIGHTTVLAEAKEVGDPASGHAGFDDLGLVGESDAIASVRAQIRQVARLTAPVLVLGESGTGKDVVAVAIHRLSGRGGPYLPLNMAAFSEGLIDAELFGHQRGSFTGAEASRPGAFEQAHGGTLFLDEIADFSPSGQAKLLRVIEDGMIRAVGSAAARKVDVRLISATCAPLEDRVLEERFRHDLYHRLSTLVVEVPPLRRRRADIPILARALLARMSGEVGHKHLSPSALDLLLGAAFPGNVRELAKTLYRAAALYPGDVIEPGHLELSRESSRTARLDYRTAAELVSSHGSISAAARAAGVPRTTLRSVLERHGPARTVKAGARVGAAFAAGEVESQAPAPERVRESSVSR